MQTHLLLFAALASVAGAAPADLRIGIVGTDTSHVVAFAALLNDLSNPDHVAGARVTAAFRAFSPDVEESRSRVDQFCDELRDKYGVTFYPTMEQVAQATDALLIMNVDGRRHLPEARRLFPFHHPVFIDKPLAASLSDAIAIFRLAAREQVPCFSSSDERFTAEMAEFKTAPIGRQLGVFAYGPADLEPHHPDLYWYGIHAVEKMYTLLGTGCQSVVRTHTDDTDVVTGVWADGRVGTMLGIRGARHTYGTMDFGTRGNLYRESRPGYRNMVEQIVKFCRTGRSPVPARETIELLTFMSAADASKARGGEPVKLADVLAANGGPL